MKRTLLTLAVASLLAACSQPQEPPKSQASTAPAAPPAAKPAPAVEEPLKSGIDVFQGDPNVKPGDDFYRHVSGKWLDTFEIPADKPGYGSFTKVFDETQVHLHGIIDKITGTPQSTGTNPQKIGDLYLSYMDEAKLDQLGAKPLDRDFAAIDAIKDKKEIATLIGDLGKSSTSLPFFSFVHQDNKDSTKYVVDFQQSGLGLPDRDYYLKDDDAKLKQMRADYEKHVEKMLALAGDKNSAKDAKDILALETEIAKAQWTKVELRDPQKAYNKIETAKLDTVAPNFDWKAYLDASEISGKVDYVIVGQPTYMTALTKIIAKTPLPVWKAYFRWHVLNDYARFLSKPFVDENFAFNGTTLSGTPQDQPRWKKGIGLVNGQLGEALGQAYVEQYFPPEYKARMEQLVSNLLAAYKADIDTLDWMQPATKQAAQAKLAKFAVKIGYPDKWRDYSKYDVSREDLVGNVKRGNTFEYERNLAKLGRPIDRGEWGMTPQTINAEYNPEENSIEFPAAILQPPFFDPKADDAVNYGAIGAVIGHEISHGFDDQGAQYDGDGNLRDWWTKEDHVKFDAKKKALIAEYNQFEPVKGYHVNGELTLGENIADNSGLAIAYKAFKIATKDKPSPSIDGLTSDQRLYSGWAQVWRSKMREPFAIQLTKVDPHSPGEFRANGALVNQPGFYEAFGVKEGDKMYRAPDQRVIIW
ncbi:MAG TPA: M13 family metallopeptidase [Rudaea sp.]|jgi:predicted metalloendopeptidase|nr:M13 family metallopeptidase [Rudaea sp.]